MGIEIGQQLGALEVTGLLGKGGMGEVYRARDTKLKRDVAIKILPVEFSRDLERVSRFQREAEILASLNHPNIGAIYDLQEAAGSRFLVLELIEGQTLAERISRGGLPLGEILSIARQICEALEAAHEKGITHRDLKPANIKITPDGKVKLLDFGLARIFAEPSRTDLSNSPTLMSDSIPGVILGTAAYMSPEQAKGESVDRRTDIWAFGCVLYEMLTGRAAFAGKTLTEILGAIIHKDIDWLALPPSTPAKLRDVLRRCLQKDSSVRLRDIGDARIEIGEVQTGPQDETSFVATASRKQRITRVLVVALTLTTLVLSGLLARTYFSPKRDSAIRFSVPLPQNTTLPVGVPFADAPFPTISPDGRYMAFIADTQGRRLLWVQSLDSAKAQALPETEDAMRPFWSPDSRFVAFFAGRKLKKIPLAGGLPQVLCEVNELNAGIVGGTWNQGGVIIFNDSTGSLYRVSSTGGVPTPLIDKDQSRPEFLGFPYFLPDGRRFLYIARSAGQVLQQSFAVYLASLDSNERKRIFVANSRVIYSAPGYLLFAESGKLMALPFNVRRGEITGETFPVVDQIAQGGVGPFSVSDNGILAFREGSGGANSQLIWFDRAGKQLGIVTDPGGSTAPALSPDGQRLAVQRGGDIWLIDLMRGTNSRFTFEGGANAIWSADGKAIVFNSTRKGQVGLYQKAANGGGNDELLLEPTQVPMDWSSDGRFILFRRNNNPNDVWALPTFGDRKPFPVLQNKFTEDYARLSPDGHWIVYMSNESGRQEIYVRNFPPSGGKWQVSVEGGVHPRWRGDGKEIIYDSPARKVMAVDVKLGSTFEAGVPHMLFEIPGPIVGPRWVMTSDGQRFLFPLPAVQASTPPITVIQNWTAALEKK